MTQQSKTRPEGLEPPTYRFEVCHSIQLSYGRIGYFWALLLYVVGDDFEQLVGPDGFFRDDLVPLGVQQICHRIHYLRVIVNYEDFAGHGTQLLQYQSFRTIFAASSEGVRTNRGESPREWSIVLPMDATIASIQKAQAPGASVMHLLPG